MSMMKTIYADLGHECYQAKIGDKYLNSPNIKKIAKVGYCKNAGYPVKVGVFKGEDPDHHKIDVIEYSKAGDMRTMHSI